MLRIVSQYMTVPRLCLLAQAHAADTATKFITVHLFSSFRFPALIPFKYLAEHVTSSTVFVDFTPRNFLW